MTPQKQTELAIMMKEVGSVTITIVGYDGEEPFDETYDNIDEAISAINGHENDSQVFF